MPNCEICGDYYAFTPSEAEMDPRPPYRCPKHRGRRDDGPRLTLQQHPPEAKATPATMAMQVKVEVQRVKHRKRESTYRVLGQGNVQTDVPLPDNAPVVIYQSEADGRLWVRPVAEFSEDRFEALPPFQVIG